MKSKVQEKKDASSLSFCRCGSLIVKGECSAYCTTRKPLPQSFYTPNTHAIKNIKKSHDPISAPHQRHSDLGR